jgi:hypothetical protein
LSESLVSTLPPASPLGPDALPFGVTDQVTGWDPVDRRLEIGTRHFWVAPDVPVSGVRPGVEVTLRGHVERPMAVAARWLVTEITLH